MKTEKQPTKAAQRTADKLERRGYDTSHTTEDGRTVMVLREKNVWVEILPNGSYRPA